VGEQLAELVVPAADSSHKDIASKLPSASRRFNQVNGLWESIMAAVNENS
jgi:hypothetical protein